MKTLFNNIFKNNDRYDYFNELIDEKKDVLLEGLNDQSRAIVLYENFIRQNRDMIVIVKDEKTAIELVDELKSLTDEVVYFPTKDIVFFDSYAHSNELRDKRINVLNLIKSEEKHIVVTVINSLLVKMVDKELWYEKYKIINMDSIFNLKKFEDELIKLGYERNNMVQFKGSFSIRGGIIDIFPIISDFPYRIELFGDEIDSIRKFDISTQRTISEVEEFKFGPCREIILDDMLKKRLSDKLSDAIENKSVKENQLDIYRKYIEMLNENIYIDGLNNYFSLIYNNSNNFLEYFDNPLITVLSPNIISEKVNFFINDVNERFKTYLENEEVLSEQYDVLFSFLELKKFLNVNQVILIDDLKKRLVDFEYDNSVSFPTRETPRYFKKLNEFAIDVKTFKDKGYKVIIILESMEKINSLKSFLIENEIYPKINSEIIDSGEVVITQGIMKDGYILDALKTVVVTENELYGVRKFKKNKFRTDKSKIIKTYEELSVGDLVVHEEHGIGKFVGVFKLNIMNNDNDYLKINYASSGVLYIPVNQMDIIQKYIGKKKETMKLSNLNSDVWKKKKAKVKKAISEMTDELIELYSKREVAIRAIFKAVDNGKQVVFLVPTTILAQQHYKNLKERFSKYPINVEVLSRFKTKKEQEDIVKRLKIGLVDIIIGTHRVLSKDIKYNSLGLLVIDEEQRFGVKDKEKIKFIKENVDILTLTATPIPRTLHMSMIGIRDMSVIEDPPENRYPVQTYVTEFDEVLVREAISREIARDGQVYFVHNRVKDIEEFSLRIQNLIPGLKIRYAHGQMSSRKLEKIMVDFLNYEFDVLISTTIIETGLDIPRVNTILINDADNFGLSQLYQLRGRVGRSNKIAYAYLLYKEKKVLSEIAEKRLKAIKNFTELGAGFKIAMRDLEIRGAGNLLGVSQHGEMESIGYELYTKLLEESIKKARGEKIDYKIETNINLKISAFIPDNYISNSNFKLEMYKKVSVIESEKDVVDIQDEFIDRFGDIPVEVEVLIDISLLKAMLEKLCISDVVDKNTKIGFTFTDDGTFNLDVLSALVKEHKRRIRIPDQLKPYFEYHFSNKVVSDKEKLQEINNVIKKVYKEFV